MIGRHLAGFVIALIAGALISASVAKYLFGLHLEANNNLWFEADVPRVIANLTDAASDHYRTSVHPLTSLLLSTPAIALIELGVPKMSAALALAIIGAAILPGLFFLLLYRLHGHALTAGVFTSLLLCSAAFLFFSGVVELYVWGAISIVLALILATVEGRLQPVSLIVAGIASVSITITNFMAGALAGLTRERAPRAVLYCASALAIVAALSVTQRSIYPTAGDPFALAKEGQYADWDIANRIRHVPRVFVVGSVVQYRLAEEPHHTYPRLSSQHGTVRPGLVGLGASALWLALLCGGIFGALRQIHSRDQVRRTLARMALLLVAAQFALHLVYGGETFLYALHFAPLLILLASFIAFSSRRSLALWATGALIVLAGWHNWQQLSQARTMAEAIIQSKVANPPLAAALSQGKR